MPFSESRTRDSTMPHTYQTSMIFDSFQADNVSPEGDRFTVNFGSDSLKVPKNAENITISVEQCQVFNSVPNIFDSGSKQNNTLEFTIDNQPYKIELQKGLYGIDTLQDAVNRELVSLFQSDPPSDDFQAPFELQADEATSKVIILFREAVDIDFTKPFNFSKILGFDEKVVSGLVNDAIPGDTTANFNIVTSFLIGCDLVDQGIRVNNRYQGVICLVPIDVGVNENIVYEPRNPAQIDANVLRNCSRSSVTFNLYDQKLQPVDLNGESFGCRILLSYTM